MRLLAKSIVGPVSAMKPYAVLTLPRIDHYWRTLSDQAEGEWDLHPLWRPPHAFEVPAAWLSAVLSGHRAVAGRLDVTVPSQRAAAIAAAVDRFGRLDVLVNNAGFGSVGAVEEIEDGPFRALMETMFFGPLALTQAALPVMRRKANLIKPKMGRDRKKLRWRVISTKRHNRQRIWQRPPLSASIALPAKA